MYKDFFHFNQDPFNNTPNHHLLFLSLQHEEALESMVYGIKQRKGFIAIIGDIGTGKTTLCRSLLQRIQNHVNTAVIFNPMLSVPELLLAINDDFGLKSSTDRSIKSQIDALNRFLLTRLKQNQNAVVIIDEAQHLTTEAFEMLRMLSNLETEDKKLLQIIFVGQRELEGKLASPELKQLNQRISIRYYLKPLNFQETCGYIVHRLALVSQECSVQFEETALKRVYKHSGGVPRIINNLCDRALLDAYAERQHTITKKTIRRVILDLNGASNPHDSFFFKKIDFSAWRRVFG